MKNSQWPFDTNYKQIKNIRKFYIIFIRPKIIFPTTNAKPICDDYKTGYVLLTDSNGNFRHFITNARIFAVIILWPRDIALFPYFDISLLWHFLTLAFPYFGISILWH